jgi:group I intron endonuclease
MNGQLAAKSLNSIILEQEKSSTTILNGVQTNVWKRGASFIILKDEEIVWSHSENYERFNKRYHYIYKTTNILTEEYYLGRHSTNNIKDNYMGSGTRFKRNLKKYGKYNFKKEILYFAKNINDLIRLEKSIITTDMLNDIKCLNLTVGGMNPILIGVNNPNFGKKLPEHVVKLMSERAKKRTGSLNPFYGKIHNDNTKQILSKNAKNRIKDKNPFYGKNHSDETKLKISLKNKNPSKERIYNLKLLRSKGLYITPFGSSISSVDAAKLANCSKATIYKRCIVNNNKLVGNNYQIPLEYKGILTWYELGWSFIKSDAS